jgi:hypothetical protein
MKAPVVKVDCNKGGEVESRLVAKEAKGGYTPRSFPKSAQTVLFVEVGRFLIREMKKSAEVVLE